MTIRIEFEPATYADMIHLLKQEGFFSITEWAQHYVKVQEDIEKECQAICDELYNRIMVSDSWKEDFLRLPPDELVDQFLDMHWDKAKMEIFRDHSFYFRKMERLEQLQEYLRELKQLN